MNASLAHLLFALAIVGAYVGLSVTGHDATPLLTILVGQGAAIGIEKVTSSEK